MFSSVWWATEGDVLRSGKLFPAVTSASHVVLFLIAFLAPNICLFQIMHPHQCLRPQIGTNPQENSSHSQYPCYCTFSFTDEQLFRCTARTALKKSFLKNIQISHQSLKNLVLGYNVYLLVFILTGIERVTIVFPQSPTGPKPNHEKNKL